MSGGNFADGFVNGAMVRGLNDELHAGLTGKAAGWAKGVFEFVTGREVAASGGAIGVMVTTPSVAYNPERGFHLEGRFDIGWYTSDDITEGSISGPVAPKGNSIGMLGFEVGASGAPFIMDGQPNYDASFGGQFAGYGGAFTIDGSSWGVDFRFGPGSYAEGAAVRTAGHSWVR